MGLERRSFVLGVAAQSLVFSSQAFATSDLDMYREDPIAIDRWMQAWMGSSKEPVGTLQISRFADPMYFVTRPIEWHPNPGQTLPAVTVPIGFVTDFASIPRVFWSLLRPDGLYTYPAILHDYLYWFQTTDRGTADNVLYAGMEDFNVGAATKKTIYEAVHSFGGAAWKENARLKANGESRVLTKMPDDPRITWAQWKTDPTHFL